MTARVISQVPAGTHGPWAVRLVDRRWAVWSEPAEAHRAWKLLELGRGNQPRIVAASGREVSTTAVRAQARGRRLWVGWTEPTSEGGEALFSLLVEPDGHQSPHVVELTKSPGRAIVWMDALETARGTAVLWASSEGDSAQLFGVALDASGNPRGEAKLLFDEVRAWQAVANGGELSVVVTRVVKDRALGPVELGFFDGERMSLEHTTVVEDHPIAESNVDLVPIESGLLVAYVERSHHQSRVMTAVVGEQRRLTAPPAALGPALGEESLLRLVSLPPAGRAAVIWENLTEPTPRRTLSMSFLDREGRPVGHTRRFRCRPDVDLLPEFAVTERGIAILTMDDEVPVEPGGEGTASARSEPSAEGDTPMRTPLGGGESIGAVGPTLLEYDARGELLRVVPLVVSATSDQRWLAWDLDCDDGCHALAAHGTESAEVFTVDFTRAPEAGVAVASLVDRLVVAEAESQQLRLTEVQILEKVPELSDLAVRRHGSDTLLGFVTEFDPKTPLVRLATPGEDGRTDPLRARLETRLWKAGAPLSPLPPATSFRARSASGVELAWSASGQDALLVWTAEDGANAPQVFVTRVDAQGKKLGQRMLTRKRGDLGELGVVATEDGWLVAWTDERTGKSELYATALSRDLERRGDERRLTPDARAVGEVALFPRGATVSILYGDARESREPGPTQLFMTTVNSRDATPRGKESRLFSSPHSAHSLRVTALGAGDALVTFLEDEAELGTQGVSRRLRYGFLAQDGTALSEVGTLPGERGRLVAYGVDCHQAGCLVVMRTHAGDEGWLEASVINRGEALPSRAAPVMGGLGAPLHIAPVVSGWSVFFAERGETGTSLIQRAELDRVP